MLVLKLVTNITAQFVKFTHPLYYSNQSFLGDTIIKVNVYSNFCCLCWVMNCSTSMRIDFDLSAKTKTNNSVKHKCQSRVIWPSTVLIAKGIANALDKRTFPCQAQISIKKDCTWLARDSDEAYLNSAISVFRDPRYLRLWRLRAKGL